MYKTIKLIIAWFIKKIKTLKEINILKGIAAVVRSGKVIGDNIIKFMNTPVPNNIFLNYVAGGILKI